jgi:hypothetical protein
MNFHGHILLWVVVLRFILNKCGSVLCIDGGFKQILLMKFMFSFVYEAIGNEFKMLMK